MSTVSMPHEIGARLLETMAAARGVVRSTANSGHNCGDLLAEMDVRINLLGEAVNLANADAARERDEDAWLTRLLGAVSATCTRDIDMIPSDESVTAACRAIREMVPALGTPVAGSQLTAQLREAVRQQPVVVNVEIGAYTSSTPAGKSGAWRSSASIPRVVVSRVPVLNESIELGDGRRVRVISHPEHFGVSAVLCCRLLSTPQPEDNF